MKHPGTFFVNKYTFLLCNNSIFFFIGGVAPGSTHSTTMIMEGLETLVTPTHHTFLLTESAAAAHFNVLGLDTGFLKSVSQSSALSATPNITTAHISPVTASNFVVSQHQHQQHQSLPQQSASHHRTTSEQVSIPNLIKPLPTVRSVSVLKQPSTHLSLITESSSSANNISTQRDKHKDNIEDLNTPISTSSIPSFFGPSSVLEPPPITGLYRFVFFYNFV